MTAEIIKLPTFDKSYVTVRKEDAGWIVEVVTPAPGKPVRRFICSINDKEMAYSMGRKAAGRLNCPFKVGGRTA